MTETGRDLSIKLPDEIMAILRWHADHATRHAPYPSRYPMVDKAKAHKLAGSPRNALPLTYVEAAPVR